MKRNRITQAPATATHGFRPAIAACLCLLTTLCPTVFAAKLEIPLAFDYRVIDQALHDQVFSSENARTELFADKIRCNTLVLSEPSIAGVDGGRMRLLTTVDIQAGTPLGRKCWFAKSWRGLIETSQTAYADPENLEVAFKIVDSTLLDASGQHEVLPGFVRKLIRDHVHPRLGAIRIDLRPVVAGLQDLLDAVTNYLPGENMAQPQPPISLAVTEVQLEDGALIAVLSSDIADIPADWSPPVAAPLSEEELARWDESWRAWDGFATWLIKSLAAQAGADLTRELAETLLTARYDLRDALAGDRQDVDEVRSLFLKTWDQLAPLLHDAQLEFPGAQAIQYAAFISAGNALRALDSLAPHLGMRLDRNALRTLARVLDPKVSDRELSYDQAVDPELRTLLGLEPQLEDGEEPMSILSWLIPSAHAAQIDPVLLEQLNEWVPKRREVDRYLESVEQLLDAIAEAERDKGKVPAPYLDIYDTLFRATAWQESCWRQYIVQEGEVQTIRSSAGSVGLMQINMHVWRGVYDIDELTGNIGYNTRAGNEILVHYLVDYALRKKEHEIEGQPDSLARATYAVYNGGPRHLRRYRDPDEPESLKKIDQLFWEKYRAIQSEGARAVKQCLTG